MNSKELWDKIPSEGFLKTNNQNRPDLTGKDKSALIRRGNQLFNEGEFEKAKRIFLTTGYTDGIIRVGDYYFKQNQMMEAFRMYWMAPEQNKVDFFIEKMAYIIKSWLKEKEISHG